MTTPLKQLRRIYLCTHAGAWVYQADTIAPMDERERERRFGMGEHWPGRAQQCIARDHVLIQEHEQLINDSKDDEGFFYLGSNPNLLETARKKFGPRCVALRLENDFNQNCKALGDDFVKGIEEDRRAGKANRGIDVPENEVSAWGRSKAWTIDLMMQLHEQGYTFDPADVHIVAFGCNWIGCGAAFPIHMGRAFGLAEPIERRFDWMNADWSPMLMNAQAVDQNLPMAEHIRLFIYRTADVFPTYGRYVAHYWEGMRGIMDRPHVVKVDFPHESVMECDVLGWPLWRTQGVVGYPYRCYFGEMTMHVGCGAHTSLHASVAMTDDNTSLEDFRKALLAGKVLAKPEQDGSTEF